MKRYESNEWSGNAVFSYIYFKWLINFTNAQNIAIELTDVNITLF